MRRWRTVIARLSAVAMLASLLALVGGSSASADPIPATNWAPVAIGADIPGASYVMTDPSGGATVGCWTNNNSPTVMFKSFSSSGGTVQNPTYGTPAGQFCNTNGTVGKDGTVYMTVSSLSVPTHYYIQAWKNNSLVWQYTIPCSSDAYPTSMVMGANGNVYMAVQRGGSCSNDRLIGLSPTAQSGSNPPVPQEVMNIPVLNTPGVYEQGLAAYNDGLVLYTRSSTLQYVPYSATSTNDLPSAIPVGVTGSYIGSQDRWFEANPDGKVFLPVPATTAQVNNCFFQSGLTGGILAVTPANSPSNPPTPLTLYGCYTMHEMHPTPSGGVAMRYAFSDVTTNGEVERISANGWVKSIGSPIPTAQAHMAVDLNGNIALRNNAAPMYTVNGSSWLFPEIDFTLFSAGTGEVITSAGFSLRGEHDTVSGPSYKWGGSGDLALAKNTVYVTAQQCTNLSYCPADSTKLYAFTVPGVQMDYPRAAILKYDEPLKTYVGLGDSFSSGQGVPPYDSGTDTAGPPENRCMRSPRAYARLLSGTPGLRLNLAAFVACGGATTSDVENGRFNEDPQLNAINDHHPDVITITIGGNDVGFKDLANACVTNNPWADCADSPAYAYTRDQLDNHLASNLAGLFSQISSRIGSTTRVLVLGYPMLIPDPAINTLPNCPYLSHGDKVTAQGVINDLNQKVSGAVTAAGSHFEYVDPNTAESPFKGHELCMDGGYFNGVDLNNQADSLHPNQLGQDAYRWVAARYLTTHP